MKKAILRFKLFAVCAVISFSGVLGQTLEEIINKNLPNIATTKSFNEMMGAMAQFDLAAAQYPDDWVANYYAGFAKAMGSFNAADMQQKDMLLDEADIYFEKTKQLGPDNAETYILGAMIANARLSVDGEHRWQKYGAIFNEQLEKAKSLNPDNPRIYYLKGTSTFYTPQMFGGGKQNALPLFEKAKDLFDKEDKSSVLKPHWGAEPNSFFISECKKPDEAPVETKGKKEKKKKKGS